MRKLHDGNLRMRSKRRQSDTASRGRHPIVLDTQTLAWLEEATAWGEKIKWLQDVRGYLKSEHRRYEAGRSDASGATAHNDLMPTLPTETEQVRRHA